jgi:predicted nucleic acid-binding protein
MKYLFDSSATFRAIKENKVEVLNGEGTLELARYELGSILWKDHVLQARISERELKLLMRTIKHTLAVMDIQEIVSSEEEILGIATKLKMTFYDASYVYVAKAKELRLVTEDLRLIKKVAQTVNVSTLDDIK